LNTSNDEILEKYLLAGKIAANAREKAAALVKPGAMVLEICEFAENYILQSGAKLAFPCNISINEIAAHYTPFVNDLTKIPKKGLVKIDVGAHIDGYIADTAKTVDIDGSYQKLTEASLHALTMAIEHMRPDESLSNIGKIIMNSINSYGFKPIRNLTGHLLQRYILHAGKSVPNVPMSGLPKIKVDEVYAIEPFATDGAGSIFQIRHGQIFSCVKKPTFFATKSKRELWKILKSKFGTLPFAARWLKDTWKEPDERLHKLAKSHLLYEYPPLIEYKRGMVSQWEHTVIVTSEGPIITTKI